MTADAFPGMPDRVRGLPPKATAEPEPLTLDEAIGRSHALLDRVLEQYPIVATYCLLSGGNDSAVLTHLMRTRIAGVIHINTGTGIPATTQHVRDVTAAWGLPLHELHPRDNYDDLVLGKVRARTGPNLGRQVWIGFPGPAGHTVMYRRLKDEPLQRFRREIVGAHGRTRKIVYLAGMRWAESDRRFRNASEIDPDGAIIWTSPLAHWTNDHMREYRARYRCDQNHTHAPHRLCAPDALPLNEVTTNLHMSGECLCGAYAKPGELDEIAFFYPQVAERIRALEEQVAATGIEGCKWGQRPRERDRDRRSSAPAGRLCSSCVEAPGQLDLADDWLERGLITHEQHAALQAVTP